MFDIFCHKIFFNFENNQVEAKVKDLIDLVGKTPETPKTPQIKAQALKNGSCIGKYVKRTQRLRNETKRCINEALHERAFQEKDHSIRKRNTGNKK